MNRLLQYLLYKEFYFSHGVSKIKYLLNKKKYSNRFKEASIHFAYKKGFEIGGPSMIFKKVIPIYPIAERIDNCNFSNHTLWEEDIQNNNYHYWSGKTGKQYISEGSDLSYIKDEEYDFLLSSHNLEHMANPIKALNEWKRILKPGGVMLLALPDKRFTFDRKRPITTYEHILNDYRNNTTEDDQTHIEEILKLHALNFDPLANGRENFEQRLSDNFKNRSAHHHVFDQNLLKQMLTGLNLKVLTQYFISPYHQIIIGQKM